MTITREYSKDNLRRNRNLKNNTVRRRLQKIKDDFRLLLKNLWKIDPSGDLPPDCVPHRVQYDIAHWLQHGPRFRIVHGFRGLSKTWITVAYCLWRFLRNPNEKILICSAGGQLSIDIVHMMRVWINKVSFLRHLKPRAAVTSDEKKRNSATRFDVGCVVSSKAPSVFGMGILGQLPGNRASIVIADDIEAVENTRTLDARNVLRGRIAELVNVLLPEGDIIYLGTPHHEETLYRYLVDECGFTCRSWPIEYPRSTQPTPYLAPMLRHDMDNGLVDMDAEFRPVWPELHGVEDIITRRSAGKINYAMQHMLCWNLSNEDRYPLKLEDLIVFPVHRDKAPNSIAWGRSTNDGSTAVEDIRAVGLGGDRLYAPIMVDTEWTDYHGCMAFLDPAGAGADELSWAIAGQLHGNIFVKHVEGFAEKPTVELMEHVVETLRDHRATRLIIEEQGGGEALALLIEPIIRRLTLKRGSEAAIEAGIPEGWHCSVDTVHSVGQKEVRIIDTVEGPMLQHRIVVSHEVAADEKLCYQLTRITRQRKCMEHDDRIESFAGVVGLFKDRLRQDAGSISEKKRKKRQLELTKKHRRFAKKKRESWVTMN